MQKILLTECFDQPFAPRPEAKAFHRQILLLEAIVRMLQLSAGRARLVQLTLQVAELALHLAEPLRKAAEKFLARKEIVRDLIGSLHHDYIYVVDGALGKKDYLEFSARGLKRAACIPLASSRFEARSTPVSNKRELGCGQLDAVCISGVATGTRGGIELLEGSSLESLVPDDEAVAFPEEHLDAITAAIERTEEMSGEWILSEIIRGPCR